MPVDLPSPAAGARRHDLASGWSLWVFEVGLACCAVEYVAAATTREHLAARSIAAPMTDPGAGHVMVVSGTVTDVLAPAVLRLYEELPAPRYVVSFGSCANTGGPYWDSYCVTKGIDQLIPVDVYVPGCPPRPEALVEALRELQERIGAAR